MEMLNNMALFVEVVKVMSFRRAAEATGVPSSTLSRRISMLEKSIGLRLLHRTTRKIELTESGQIYYQRCRRIVEEARLAHEQLGEIREQPTGLLRASLPIDFAISFLAPLMAQFAERYPDIRFEFDLTPRKVDLVSEPFDMAVRMGEQQDSTLIARLLANLPVYVYASPGYLARFGEPRHPSELARHQCLGFPRNERWSLYHRDTAECAEVGVSGRFTLNSMGMIRTLAAFDHGIVQLTQEVARDEVTNGRLKRILPDWQGAAVPVYAMTETRLLPAKTQCFLAFLKESFAY